MEKQEQFYKDLAGTLGAFQSTQSKTYESTKGSLTIIQKERDDFDKALDFDLVQAYRRYSYTNAPERLQNAIVGHRNSAYIHLKGLVLKTFNMLCQKMSDPEDNTKIKITESFLCLKFRLRDRFTQTLIQLHESISRQIHLEVGHTNKSQRGRATVMRVDLLEATFRKNPYPSPMKVKQLSDRTGNARELIHIWFSQKRAEIRKLPIKKRHIHSPIVGNSKVRAWQNSTEQNHGLKESEHAKGDTGAQSCEMLQDPLPMLHAAPASRSSSQSGVSTETSLEEDLSGLLNFEVMKEVCRDQTLHTPAGPCGMTLGVPLLSSRPFTLLSDDFWKAAWSKLETPGKQSRFDFLASHDTSFALEDWSSWEKYTTSPISSFSRFMSPTNPFMTNWSLSPKVVSSTASLPKLTFSMTPDSAIDLP